MNQKTNNTRSGSGLIFAVVLLFVILGMVITLSSITVLETKMNQKTKSSVGAFYNSESGVEWALNQISIKNGTAQISTIGACPFTGCSVLFLDQDGKVLASSATIDQIKAVRSIGTQSGETQRTIEAAVASGGGGCYIDYSFNTPLAVGSPCRVSGFTNKGSAGTWGSSASGNTGANRSCPAGGPCTTILGEAWVCCQ